MKAQPLPGFRDFYPNDTALRNHIFAVWRDVATRYGFEEYDGPPLEELELYTQKSGEEIVAQLYTFEDKGGRQVALRPEMTPTLARRVARRARALKKPIRWFAIPQLFRYERRQRGRLREHFQLNMDLIGESNYLADAEVIAAAIDVMRGLGLGPTVVRVRVSDRLVAQTLLSAQGLTASQITAAYAHIDKLARESRDALVDELAASAGLSLDNADRALRVGELKGVDAVMEALGEVKGGAETGENLKSCLEALDAMSLGEFIDVDLSTVRGLAYYTGIVFELFDAQHSLRAICGGGRYDDLLAARGGVDLPAVGFGMGDVVLSELLRDQKKGPPTFGGPDAFLVAVTGADVPHVLRIAHELRDRGVRVEFALKQQSIAKQLKLAAARPARHAVLIGPDEREAGKAVVRDLETGKETRIAFGSLAAFLAHGD